MKIGSVIFYSRIPSFLSWVQRQVLGTPYSHTSILCPDYMNKPIEFEADLKVRYHTYEHSNKHRDIYELIDVPDEVILFVLHQLRKYEDKIYGFVSWLAILIRRIFEVLGFKNAKSWDILVDKDLVCSELLWHYLNKISNIMGRVNGNWAVFQDELHIYNPNIFTPKDISYLLNKYNSLFRRYK